MLGHKVFYNNTLVAEIIRADVRTDHTVFISPPDSSFQFGLLAHQAGFVELPHYHKAFTREVADMQQMFVMQRGVVVVELFTDAGELFREIELRAGDAIVLIRGIHGLRVVEDFQAISVKQGPFLGSENDKVNVTTTKP